MLLILGDVHGNWPLLNRIITTIVDSHPNESHNIIVCGDFGYWPRVEQFSLDKIDTHHGQITIHFCPGNHENWNALLQLEKENPDNKAIKVSKDIWYHTFGSTLNIKDKVFMFCGGADSIDKNQRTPGFDWFPEEVITEKKVNQIPQNIEKVDVMISHTCPENVIDYILPERRYAQDISRLWLDTIWSKYRPREWFFGHFHKYKKFTWKDTAFTCLNMIGRDGYSNIYF